MSKGRHYKQAAYEQVIAFRQRGFTYTEIAKICNVSRGTVSNWLHPEPFSQLVAEANKKRAIVDNTKRLALINKARVSERKQQYVTAERTAVTEYQHYRASPLFVAGVVLYMTEGDLDHPHLIRLSNSRADLHKLFISFARSYLGVEKTAIRCWLLLYPGLTEEDCLKYWSKQIGVPLTQFHKTQTVKGRHTKQILHFGVGNTIICSTLLKRKLQKWIALAKKDLIKK